MLGGSSKTTTVVTSFSRQAPKRTKSYDVTAVKGQDIVQWETSPMDDGEICSWDTYKLDEDNQTGAVYSHPQKSYRIDAREEVHETKRKFLIPVTRKQSLVLVNSIHAVQTSEPASSAEQMNSAGVNTPKIKTTLRDSYMHLQETIQPGRGRSFSGNDATKSSRRQMVYPVQDQTQRTTEIQRHLHRILKQSQEFQSRTRYLDGSKHHAVVAVGQQISASATNNKQQTGCQSESARILQIRKLFPTASQRRESLTGRCEMLGRDDIHRQIFLASAAKFRELNASPSKEQMLQTKFPQPIQFPVQRVRESLDSIVTKFDGENYIRQFGKHEGNCKWQYYQRRNKLMKEKQISEKMLADTKSQNIPHRVQTNNKGKIDTEIITLSQSRTPEKKLGEKSRKEEKTRLASEASFFAKIFEKISSLDRASVLIHRVQQTSNPQKLQPPVLLKQTRLDNTNSLSPTKTSTTVTTTATTDRVKKVIANLQPTCRYNNNNLQRKDLFDAALLRQRCHSVNS